MTKVLIACFLFSLIAACSNSKKTSTTKENSEEITAILEAEAIEMNRLGFVEAIVSDFSKSDAKCGFLIKLDKTKQILQPLQPIDLAMQKDGITVWVKYRAVRPIAPACKQGIPVSIEEIKLR